MHLFSQVIYDKYLQRNYEIWKNRNMNPNSEIILFHCADLPTQWENHHFQSAQMRDTAQEQNAPVQLLLEPSIDDPIFYFLKFKHT